MCVPWYIKRCRMLNKRCTRRFHILVPSRSPHDANLSRPLVQPCPFIHSHDATPLQPPPHGGGGGGGGGMAQGLGVRRDENAHSPRRQPPPPPRHAPLPSQTPKRPPNHPDWTMEYNDERREMVYRRLKTRTTVRSYEEMQAILREDSLAESTAKVSASKPIKGWTVEYNSEAKRIFYRRVAPPAEAWTYAEMLQIEQRDARDLAEKWLSHSYHQLRVHDAAPIEPPQRSPEMRRAQRPTPKPRPHHHGVRCNVSRMSPIVGTRYREIGKDYNLCRAEFNKLPEPGKAKFEAISHPGAVPVPVATARPLHSMVHQPPGRRNAHAASKPEKKSILAKYRRRLTLYLNDGVLSPEEEDELREDYPTDVVTEDEHRRMCQEIMATMSAGAQGAASQTLRDEAQINAMGFSAEQAKAALATSKGNVVVAINALLVDKEKTQASNIDDSSTSVFLKLPREDWWVHRPP